MEIDIKDEVLEEEIAENFTVIFVSDDNPTENERDERWQMSAGPSGIDIYNRSQVSENEEKSLVHQCEKCSVQYSSLIELKTHIIDTHTEYFYCSYCNIVNNGKLELKEHVLNEHVKNIDKTNIFSCCICKDELYSKENAFLHVKENHEKVLLPANPINEENESNSSSIDQNSIKINEETNSKNLVENEDFYCSYCNIVSKNKSALRNHIFNVHIKSRDKFNDFVCLICNHLLFSKRNAISHVIKSHKQVKLSSNEMKIKASKSISLDNNTKSTKYYSNKKRKECEDRNNESSCIYMYICIFCKIGFHNNIELLKNHLKNDHTLEYINWTMFWRDNSKYVREMKKIELCKYCKNIIKNDKVLNTKLTPCMKLCNCNAMLQIASNTSMNSNTMLESTSNSLRNSGTISESVSDISRNSGTMLKSTSGTSKNSSTLLKSTSGTSKNSGTLLKSSSGTSKNSGTMTIHGSIDNTQSTNIKKLLFFCTICKIEFNLQDYVHHMNRIHKKGKVKKVIKKSAKQLLQFCLVCKIIFNYEDFIHHMLIRHKLIKKEVTLRPLSEDKCKICKIKLGDEKILLRHIKKDHSEMLHYKCKKCNQRILNRSFLKVHKCKSTFLPVPSGTHSLLKSNQTVSNVFVDNTEYVNIPSTENECEVFPDTVNLQENYIENFEMSEYLSLTHELIKNQECDSVNRTIKIENVYTATSSDNLTYEREELNCNYVDSFENIQTENDDTSECVNLPCQYVRNEDILTDTEFNNCEKIDTIWIKKENISFDN